MKQPIKQPLTILALSILALASYWLLHDLEKALEPDVQETEIKPLLTGYQVKGLFFGADNKLQYKVKGNSVTEYSNQGGTKLMRADVQAFNNKQGTEWVGKSDVVEIAADKSRFTLTDKVEFVQAPESDNPLFATSDHIIYLSQSKEILGNQPIVVENNEMRQTGRRFKMNLKDKKAHFAGGMHAYFQAAVDGAKTIPPAQISQPVHIAQTVETTQSVTNNTENTGENIATSSETNASVQPAQAESAQSENTENVVAGEHHHQVITKQVGDVDIVDQRVSTANQDYFEQIENALPVTLKPQQTADKLKEPKPEVASVSALQAPKPDSAQVNALKAPTPDSASVSRLQKLHPVKATIQPVTKPKITVKNVEIQRLHKLTPDAVTTIKPLALPTPDRTRHISIQSSLMPNTDTNAFSQEPIPTPTMNTARNTVITNAPIGSAMNVTERLSAPSVEPVTQDILLESAEPTIQLHSVQDTQEINLQSFDSVDSIFPQDARGQSVTRDIILESE